MSYSPLPQEGPAGSSARPPDSSARSSSPDRPNSRHLSPGATADSPHLQVNMDRLSLHHPQPAYATSTSDPGVDSILSLVRSINSDTVDSYDMMSNGSSSPAKDHREMLARVESRQSGSYAGEMDRYKDSTSQHRLSDSGILVSTDPDAVKRAPKMHSADGSDQHAESTTVSQRGLPLDPSAERLRENVLPQNAHGDPADGSVSPRRPQLHVHTPVSPPPLNVLDPQDPTFEYTHSPEDVAAALQYIESPPPEPVDSAYYGQSNDHYHHETHEAPVVRNSYGAPDFFQDFDGVHCSPDTEHRPSPSPPATDHRELASQKLDGSQSLPHTTPPSPQSRAFKSSSNLVYYPAPVPSVLNLPPLMAKPKTSRFSKLMKRGSKQLLESDREDGQRSVAYPGAGASAPGDRASSEAQDRELHNRRSMANIDEKRMSHLPPALRASQYFDSHTQSTPSAAPQIKESSAVATLNSILDASARAPPAAFTDHPIMGGPSSNNQYRNSMAVTVKLHPGESPRSSVEADDRDHLNPENSDPNRYSGSMEGPLPLEPGALPTTLMAELEARKAQQKLRTRTAASAFPTGIRSTLLQLDAVAQVQAQSRRQKRTHLAWEDPDDQDGNDKDEDVPLGLLYTVNPALQRRKDDEVPLGLLMKKEMEDAEPLSKRRERLRQEHGMPPRRQSRLLDLPSMGEEDGEEQEEEGETLAQRMKRLKERPGGLEKRHSTFGDGSLELSFAKESSEKTRDKPPPPEDETLAQRRKRLQEEKEEEEKKARLREESAALQHQVRQRQSMSGLLQQYPQLHPQLHSPQLQQQQRPGSFYGQPGVGVSVGNLGMGGAPGMGGMGRMGQTVGLVQPGMNMGMAGVVGMPHGYQAMNSMGLGGMGMNMGMNMNMNMAGDAGMTIDPKQQEMIERWRASVM